MSNVTKQTPAPRRDRPAGRRRLRRSAPSLEERAQSFEKLRSVLLRPERDRIDTLEHRPTVDVAGVAGVLPEAVARATSENERELAIALEPTVTTAVRVVARRSPELYGEILAPTIGSAVRKAVAEAIDVLLERFNAALERSLSLRSLQWRIEAARTGRPFAEVVLLRTLMYRVEQVFLIHTRTSLVLQHCVDPLLPSPPPDQVAAMLAAIEAFGREALGPLPAEAHLHRFELGEITLVETRDGTMTLAALVRGVAATSIGPQLTDALARCHTACAAELVEFSGDVTCFQKTRPFLEPLLRVERRPAPRRAHVVFMLAGVLLAFAIVGGALWMHSRHVDEAKRTASYVAALQSEPGIMVRDASLEHGHRRLSGFRDPVSAPPESVLANHGLGPAVLDLVPFVSLDPRVVIKRAERALEPPASAEVTLDGTTLHVAGIAPRSWIADARVLSRTIPGVERYDDRGLRPQERFDQLYADAAAVNVSVMTFASGTAEIAPAQNDVLKRVALHARGAADAARDARVGLCLYVGGHADRIGPDEKNTYLGDARASAVADRLVVLGVDPEVVRLTGRGELRDPRERSVTLHLKIDETRWGPGCGGVP